MRRRLVAGVSEPLSTDGGAMRSLYGRWGGDGKWRMGTAAIFGWGLLW